MSKNKISLLIKARRAKLELTAEQAAKKLKMSVNYLRLIESGYSTHVSEDLASRLVKGLGVPKVIFRALSSHNTRARMESRRWRKSAAKKSGKKAA